MAQFSPELHDGDQVKNGSGAEGNQCRPKEPGSLFEDDEQGVNEPAEVESCRGSQPEHAHGDSEGLP